MEYKKNDYLTVKIEDMSNEGEGIGKADGFTLFVKDTVIGDVARVKLMKVKKTYAYARLEELLKPSPDRTEPVCPTYRQCGGCQLQTLSYGKQLEFKQKKVRGNLIRIGGFGEDHIDAVMEPIVGMDKPLGYRNKAQYPIGTDKEGNPIAGFYAGRTHSIIANTDCALGAEENREILEILLKHMKENQIPAYDETTGQGLVRHVLIRKGFTSGEIMVCLVLNYRESGKGGSRTRQSGREELTEGAGNVSGKKDLVERAERVSGREELTGSVGSVSEKEGLARVPEEYLRGQQALVEKWIKIPGMTSVSVSINTEQTNVIMGKDIRTIWGRDTISDTIHVRDMKQEGYPSTGQELTFHISPLSFYQVNPVQTEKLYSLALEFAGLTGKEAVWDLYCGIGTISLFLAKKAGKVYGVEIVPQAIEDARENARRNGLTNAEFFVGKAEEVLPEFYGRMAAKGDAADAGMLHPDVIVVDPPRKGCDEVCLETMLRMRPERIVYVSCDSATLARDLRVLCDGGYELRRVRATDMFGMSVHVETVCLLSRKNQML